MGRKAERNGSSPHSNWSAVRVTPALGMGTSVRQQSSICLLPGALHSLGRFKLEMMKISFP